MTFHPRLDTKLKIGNQIYHFAEHPSAKNMPFGQTGRRATVFQIVTDGGEKLALKVFSNAFRTYKIATNAQQLGVFAATPGLEACKREVLSPEKYSELIKIFPDLAYSVLMPWINGETWQEINISNHQLSQDMLYRLAEQLVFIFNEMERKRLAHCDISGANVIIDTRLLNIQTVKDFSSISLVDMEEMYGPGFDRPDNPPAGTFGYNHIKASQGLWQPEADRFAGAVMLAEMLTIDNDRIKNISFGEQFFDPNEMQQNSERYKLVVSVLNERGFAQTAALFTKAWFSSNLSDCPTFSEWNQAINRRTVPYERHQAPQGKPGSNANNGPFSIPDYEQAKTLIAKAAAEDDWEGLLNIARSILQNHPGDPQALNLELRARQLLATEQSMHALWETAVLSGQPEDWQLCLSAIDRAQKQARQPNKFEQIRQEAEKKYLASIQASKKEVEEGKARQKEIDKYVLQAEQFLNKSKWAEAIEICLKGLGISAEDQKLYTILEKARKEQASQQLLIIQQAREERVLPQANSAQKSDLSGPPFSLPSTPPAQPVSQVKTVPFPAQTKTATSAQTQNGVLVGQVTRANDNAIKINVIPSKIILNVVMLLVGIAFIVGVGSVILNSLQPQKNGKLSGTVIESDTRNPISAAKVVFQSASQHEEISSDSQGNFEFSGLPTGSGTLNAVLQGYSSPEITVNIQSGSTTTKTIEMTLVGVRLKGTVYDVNSNGIEGVSIQADGIYDDGTPIFLPAQSAKDGTFEILFTSTGSGLLTFSHPQYITDTKEFQVRKQSRIFPPVTLVGK